MTTKITTIQRRQRRGSFLLTTTATVTALIILCVAFVHVVKNGSVVKQFIDIYNTDNHNDGLSNHHQQQQQQVVTSQDLPRRNVSRSLCGNILPKSPKASKFPHILSSSKILSSKSSTSSMTNNDNHHDNHDYNDNNNNNHHCAPNAILYMVQKGKHSSYKRNSTALFLQSLDLLYENYLSIDHHYDNVDVLIVHSGDYTKDDLQMLDRRYNYTVRFKLIDLNQTDYWTIPDAVRNDNISRWDVYPIFSVGYRHMIRWYALKLYDFVRDYAATHHHHHHPTNDDHAADGGAAAGGDTAAAAGVHAHHDGGCSYQYLMRMDEDSFIHSPIEYDLFEFMQVNNYSYGFRMCAYELETDVWDDYEDYLQHCSSSSSNSNSNNNSHNTFGGGNMSHQAVPTITDGGIHLLAGRSYYRRVHPKLCAFYNNFFIIEVAFVLRPDVQHFLQWTDAVGVMYRERYNDLQIQAIAVYHYLPPERIHRFLDWTYEHMTYKQVGGGELQCPGWGALQAGYLDDPDRILTTFTDFRRRSNMGRCPGIRRRNVFTEVDMSPTYSHLPPAESWRWNDTNGNSQRQLYQWRTFATGSVESPHRGIFSG